MKKLNHTPLYILLLSLFLLSSESLFAENKVHIVKKGETFEFIAGQYGITQSELLQANPKVKQCFTGLKLNIPKTSIAENNTRSSDIPQATVTSTNISMQSVNSSSDLTNNTTNEINESVSLAKTSISSAPTRSIASSEVASKAEKKKSGFMDVLDKIGQVANVLSATAQEIGESMTTNSSSASSYTFGNQNATHAISTSSGTLHLTDRQLNERIAQLEARKLNLQREFNQLKGQQEQLHRQGVSAMSTYNRVAAGDKYFDKSKEIAKKMSDIQMSVQTIDKELEKLKGVDENGETIHKSSKSPVRTNECVRCHGDKRCPSCAGRGEKRYTNMYGTTIKDCSDCRGTGRCRFCHGKGYTSTTTGY